MVTCCPETWKVQESGGDNSGLSVRRTVDSNQAARPTCEGKSPITVVHHNGRPEGVRRRERFSTRRNEKHRDGQDPKYLLLPIVNSIGMSINRHDPRIPQRAAHFAMSGQRLDLRQRKRPRSAGPEGETRTGHQGSRRQWLSAVG